MTEEEAWNALCAMKADVFAMAKDGAIGLDGWFTAAQMRAIADVLEQIKAPETTG